MKKIIIILFFFTTTNCSFDNKTGIWKDTSEKVVTKNIEDIGNLKKNKNFKKNKLEDAFLENKIFEEEKISNLNSKVLIDKVEKNINWKEQYLNSYNNISNIYYTNKIELISKSKKLGKDSLFQSIIYNKNLIFSDQKGFIYVYSIKKKLKVSEFNFYQKKFKKYEKKISLTAHANKIFAADNLGYIYALDLNKNKILWAKNFGIPFRSNIKIVEDNIIIANQDNTIFSINSFSGNVNWKFDTSLTPLKSDFINSIVVDKENKSILFLNTSGEFYSINYVNKRVNWILNFGMRADENTTSLFFSLPLTLKKDHIFISAQNTFSKYNTISAEKLWSIPLSVNIKPVLTTENIFLFTKNNLLVCLDSVSGDIIWSRNIFKQSNAEKGVNIKEADKFKLMGPIAAIKALNQSNREKLKIKETKLKNENKKVKKSFWKNPIAAISRSNREKLELGTDVGEGIFKEPIILDERYGAINNLYMAANKLFLFTAGGNLMTFNPNTGKLSFNTKIANSIAADSPMFVNGKLYFFDNSSRFYQYE